MPPLPSLKSALRSVACACALWSMWVGCGVEATAVSFSVKAHEQSCLYLWADEIGKKISFYFAVAGFSVNAVQGWCTDILHVQSGGDFDIDYVARDPNLAEVLSGNKERQGDFVFAAESRGEYAFCFSNTMSTFTDKWIDVELYIQDDKFSVRAELPKLNEHVVKNEHLTPLEESLYKLSTSLSHISRTQKYFRTREHRSFETVVSTESRIFYFATLESLLIVIMAALQVYAVRAFFKTGGKSRV